MKNKIIVALFLSIILMGLNINSFAQYRLIKQMHAYQLNAAYCSVDSIISKINSSEKITKRIERKGYLHSGELYLQTYNHYREHFDTSNAFKYTETNKYIIFDTINLHKTKSYLLDVHKKRHWKRLNKIGVSVEKVDELLEDLRRLSFNNKENKDTIDYEKTIANLLLHYVDPEKIEENFVKKSRNKKLPCFFKITVDTIGTSLRIQFLYGDTITGGDKFADKMDTLNCDPNIKDPYYGSTFPPNKYLTSTSQNAIDFISECINDIIKDSIFNPTTQKKENLYYTDDISGFITGGADMPEPVTKYYANNFEDITNIKYFNINKKDSCNMNIKNNDVLTNEKLAFLRAYSALYFFTKISKSNKEPIGIDDFAINVIVSNKYRNTADRFVKIEININGALNYLIKIQEEWNNRNNIR